MNCYADPKVFDLTEAEEKLPAIAAEPAPTFAATGTDGTLVVNGTGQFCASESASGPSARIGFASATIGKSDTAPKLRLSVERGSDMQQKTPSGKDGANEAGEGSRTLCKSSNSPENNGFAAPVSPKASPTLSLPIVADRDLQLMIEAWPSISSAIRMGIIAMERAEMSLKKSNDSTSVVTR